MRRSARAWTSATASAALAVLGGACGGDPESAGATDCADGGTGGGATTVATTSGAAGSSAAGGGHGGDGAGGGGASLSGCPAVLAAPIATMQARSWLELPANASLAALPLEDSLFYWADSAVWHEASQTVAWIGGPGTCCADPATYQRLTWSLASDTWSVEPTSMEGSGHAYDGNAIEPATGAHLFTRFNDPRVKRLANGAWSELPDLPYAPVPAMGLAWFPELAGGQGAPVHVGGLGDAAWFDGSAWHAIASPPEAWGEYNVFAEHAAKQQRVWLGGGNGAGSVSYLLDASLGLTRVADAPGPLGVGTSVHTVDPISGHGLVVYLDDQSLWEIDFATDTWAPVDATGQPALGTGGGDGSQIVVAIPPCGAVVYVNHQGEARQVFLYRHAI